MDLCWQEQGGEVRDPGEPAKAESGRVSVWVGVAKASETTLKRKMGKDDFLKLYYTL